MTHTWDQYGRPLPHWQLAGGEGRNWCVQKTPHGSFEVEYFTGTKWEGQAEFNTLPAAQVAMLLLRHTKP